jgi:uncharacterized flavoprotein (TIGR03862 family)
VTSFKTQPRVMIAGAGPAGLIAADMLSAAGAAVTIHDAMPSVGRKFLMAGRGGLNLTHSEPHERFVSRYGHNRDWVGPWIEAFSQDDVISFTQGLGQATFTGSSGRVFPTAMKASPMLRAWLARLADRGVEIITRSRFGGWNEAGVPLFAAADGPLTAHPCDGLLLALGGASWPKLGSNGHWAAALAERGVQLEPFGPSNSGVLCDWTSHLIENHAGSVLKGVRLSAGGHSADGDVIVTRAGLEGGPVYGLSHVWRDPGFDGRASLNLRPQMDAEALAAKLATARKNQSSSTILKTRLKLTAQQIALLNEAARPLPHKPRALAALVQNVPLTITGQAGLERAISSTGGIRRDAVSDQLELLAMPGTFVAGEMLDWDAPTGGYLLQACFASGVVASRGMLACLQKSEV